MQSMLSALCKRNDHVSKMYLRRAGPDNAASLARGLQGVARAVRVAAMSTPAPGDKRSVAAL